MLNECGQLWASRAAQALDARLTNQVVAPSLDGPLYSYLQLEASHVSELFYITIRCLCCLLPTIIPPCSYLNSASAFNVFVNGIISSVIHNTYTFYISIFLHRKYKSFLLFLSVFIVFCKGTLRPCLPSSFRCCHDRQFPATRSRIDGTDHKSSHSASLN